MYLKKINRNIPEKFKNSFYENSLRPYMPEGISTSKSNDSAVLNIGEDFVSESNFGIIFNDSFYYFFNNFPESIDKTKVKISFLNIIKDYSDETALNAINNGSLNYFYNLFFTGALRNNINDYDSLLLRLNNEISKLDYTEDFIIVFKNSNGDVICKTKSSNAKNHIQSHVSFSLNIPIDDNTITETTGYSINDEIYCYYNNTFYNKEYLINLGLPSGSTAQVDVEYIAENINISPEDTKDYRHEIYN